MHDNRCLHLKYKWSLRMLSCTGFDQPSITTRPSLTKDNWYWIIFIFNFGHFGKQPTYWISKWAHSLHCNINSTISLTYISDNCWLFDILCRPFLEKLPYLKFKSRSIAYTVQYQHYYQTNILVLFSSNPQLCH